MSDTLPQQVADWVDANLGLVSLRNPVSDHLDDVLGRKIEPVRMIDLALTAFVLLVEELGRRQLPAQPLLVIPLESESKRLAAMVPQDMQALKARWRQEEPPSLYLLDWDIWKLLDIGEEYRSPLLFDLLTPPVAGIYAYYREFRDKMYIENEWEFEKGIYVQYYPEEYR